jgi:hypothetical protein
MTFIGTTLQAASSPWPLTTIFRTPPGTRLSLQRTAVCLPATRRLLRHANGSAVSQAVHRIRRPLALFVVFCSHVFRTCRVRLGTGLLSAVSKMRSSSPGSAALFGRRQLNMPMPAAVPNALSRLQSQVSPTPGHCPLGARSGARLSFSKQQGGLGNVLSIKSGSSLWGEFHSHDASSRSSSMRKSSFVLASSRQRLAVLLRDEMIRAGVSREACSCNSGAATGEAMGRAGRCR